MLTSSSSRARSRGHSTRALVPLLALALSVLASNAALAATTLRLVNPFDGAIINTNVSPQVYLINGTCHQADAVGVSINDGPESWATVKGATWEWLWDLSSVAPSDSVKVVATPYLAGVAGTPVQALVKVRTALPGGSIDVLPSSVISGLFAGKGATLGDPSQPLVLAVLVRGDAGAGKVIGEITLSSPTSVNQVYTPTTLEKFNVHTLGGTAIPALFVLGNDPVGPGLRERMEAIGVTYRSAPGGLKSNIFQRRIIIDPTAPVRKQAVSATFPRKNVVALTGKFSDAASGIDSVSVEITPPGGGSTVVVPATLTYGADYYNDVTWYAEYETAVEGSMNVAVTARDNAGNERRDPEVGWFTVATDRTAPAVAFTSPAPSAFVTGSSVSIAGTVTDTAPDTWKLYDNGTFVTQGVGSAFAHTWDTTLAADGLHTLKVVATDAQRNEGEGTVTVTVDNTLPTVAFTKPANGDFVTGIVQITGAVAECNLDSWKIQVDTGGGFVDIPGATGTTTEVSALWDTNPIPASTVCTLKILATDKAGLTNAATADTITVTVVKTGSVTITDPPDGAYVKGTHKIKFTVAVDALDKWELHDLDSTPSKLTEGGTNGSFDFDWDTTGKDGRHTLKLTAKNTLGQSVDASVIVTVDNTVPTVEVTSPALGSFVRGLTPINATITDVNPDKYQINLDGSLLTPPGIRSGSTVAFSWDTTGVADGIHVIKVLATDKALNNNVAAADAVSVTVDNTAPVVVITSPAAGAVVKAPTTVSGTFTEINLLKWEWFDNGVLFASGSSPSPVSVGWSPVGDGAHVLKLVVTDQSGNTGEATVAVTVDNTPPVVTIDALPKVQDGADFFVEGVIRLVGSIIESNLLNWQLTDDNDPGLNVTDTQPGGISESYTTTGEGPHTFRLKATDKVGLTAEKTVSVLADNVRPTASLDNPTPSITVGSRVYVKGAVTVTGTVADTFFKDWKLLAQSVQLATGTTAGAISVPWDTTTVVGAVDLQLTARDRILHATTAVKTVIADNTGPQIKITSPIPGTTLPPSVAMGSILTLIFRVDHAPIEPSGARAPLKKLPSSGGDLNAPAVTVTVQGPSGSFPLSLADALTKPNLVDQLHGSATVSGSADDGYMVIWQLPILRTGYSYGKEYTIQLTGAGDVIGNAGTNDQIKFRVSLTR